MLLKCCAQYVSKFGKLSSGQRTGKGQFSFQSQRRAVSKNVQTIRQLCSFRILARLCSKSFKLGFNSMWTENFQICNLVLEKSEEPEIKVPTSVGSQKKLVNSRKNLLLLHWLLLWLYRSQQTGKFLKRWEYQTTLPASWETCMQVKKQQLEPDMEQQTGSKLAKAYVKAVYCCPA